MATTSHPMPARADASWPRPLLWGAPAAAVLAGMAAEWFDFRALRYPILLMVLLGVLATAHVVFGRPRDWRAFASIVALGVGTWAAAETVYVLLHLARGEPFEAERFGPQWSQALGLIAAHGLFLGAPTGIVAAFILRFAPAFARPRS